MTDAERLAEILADIEIDGSVYSEDARFLLSLLDEARELLLAQHRSGKFETGKKVIAFLASTETKT